jgi:hypothetical protein
MVQGTVQFVGNSARATPSTAQPVGICISVGLRGWLGQPPQKDSDWETEGVNKRNYFLATSAGVHFDGLKIAQASSLLSLPRHENDVTLPPFALVHALHHQSPWHNDIFTRLTF